MLLPRFAGRFLVGAWLLALAGPRAARAQAAYVPPVLWPGYAREPALRKVLLPGRTTATASLPFRRDPAITRQVEAGLVAKLKASDALGGGQLEQAFADQDVLVPWREALQSFGLKLDNVADAMTANWLVLYLSANEQATPPTAAQVAGLHRQVGRLCAAPGLAALLPTAARRQELADYLHLQALLLNETQTRNEQTHDAVASARLARDARLAAQQNMGFDPTTVQLTAQGLVRK